MAALVAAIHVGAAEKDARIKSGMTSMGMAARGSDPVARNMVRWKARAARGSIAG